MQRTMMLTSSFGKKSWCKFNHALFSFCIDDSSPTYSLHLIPFQRHLSLDLIREGVESSRQLYNLEKAEGLKSSGDEWSGSMSKMDEIGTNGLFDGVEWDPPIERALYVHFLLVLNVICPRGVTWNERYSFFLLNVMPYLFWIVTIRNKLNNIWWMKSDRTYDNHL